MAVTGETEKGDFVCVRRGNVSFFLFGGTGVSD
jgi:hypothetical protein